MKQFKEICFTLQSLCAKGPTLSFTDSQMKGGKPLSLISSHGSSTAYAGGLYDAL